jgi:hypothetical protein
MDSLELLRKLKGTLMPYQKLSAVRSERKFRLGTAAIGARTGEHGRRIKLFEPEKILREFL